LRFCIDSPPRSKPKRFHLETPWGKGKPSPQRRAKGLKEGIRLALLLISTIALPAFLLSVVAWSSIQSEELAIDAELSQQARLAVEDLAEHHFETFHTFERVVRQRANSNLPLTTHLSNLSPHLRAAYQLDGTGRPLHPLTLGLPAQEDVLSPSPQHTLAIQAERSGDYPLAAQAHHTLSETASDPRVLAESRFGEARNLWRAAVEAESAGEDDLASNLFGDVDLLLGPLLQSRLANTRDLRGYRLGDLASFLSADITSRDDETKGKKQFQALLGDLLERTWTIGNASEAALAQRILRTHSQEPWMQQASDLLNERANALQWSGLIENEIALLPASAPPQEFRYVGAREDTRAVWAFTQVNEKMYAFSFDAKSLFESLRVEAEQRSDLEPLLGLDILGPSMATRPTSLSHVTLAPQLPFATISARPDNLEALDTLKRTTRNRRRVVVSIALLSVIFGVLLASRILGREMESANMKADFAANVSHELRSPITQIRLKGEALQLGLTTDEEDLRRHYDAIVHESERLSRLVDNVLDFAAIERGAKRYQMRQEDLRLLVATTGEAMRAPLAARGLVLDLDIPEDFPQVEVDREAVKQVLINLLSNAAKYGAEGKWVGLRMRLALDSVDISVIDRGIGISKSDQARIFEEFYRSADANVRRNKGTGIGLSIVRYIINAHGGSLSVDSEPGQGATFTVTLPLGPNALSSE
jgi:signal transduction histidine kinase